MAKKEMSNEELYQKLSRRMDSMKSKIETNSMRINALYEIPTYTGNQNNSIKRREYSPLFKVRRGSFGQDIKEY